jgi:mannose-6-phosphate isomerase-like protein (cupin superfamily)
MKFIHTGKHLKEFAKLGHTSRSLAAMMVLAPGGCEGGPDNKHRKSDQWMYVVSGSGSVTVEGKTMRVRKGSLVLIEKGERHEIRNPGRRKLITVNVYAPVPPEDELT